MFRRVALFLLTNIAILMVMSFIVNLLGIQPYLTQKGLNLPALLIFAAIFGFTGSFISLFLSKFMAKMAYRIQIVETPRNHEEQWIYSTVQRLSREMNIGMPEIGVYESPEPNAFATGWNRNNALVAVSTGLLRHMSKDEVEAVLGHEVAHVANGDMVTMALIQGVVNTFVIFLARVIAHLVATMGRDENSSRGFSYAAYFITSIVMEMVLGILASTIVFWFSRRREFRADAGSAKIVGREKMIAALRRLKSLSGAPVDQRAPALNTMKISHRGGLIGLFMTHPPLEKRIQALMS